MRSTRVHFEFETFAMRNISNDHFTLKTADIFDVYVEFLLLLYFFRIANIDDDGDDALMIIRIVFRPRPYKQI